MSDGVEVKKVSSTEIIWAIAGLLGKFADPGAMRGEPNLYHGVSVLQNRDETDVFLFRFRTKDGLEFETDVDLRAVDKDYIDRLVARVRRTLSEARQEKEVFTQHILTRSVRGAHT